MASTKTDFSTPDISQSSAAFYASARTIINAPASLVFRTLRNTETWKDWNRWSPRVNITDQPDDEDDATIAEIEELVRNTSIAVNFDSDITDGAVNPPPDHSEAYKRASGSEQGGTNGIQRPLSPPPVTRQRLASNASRLSGVSMDGPSRNNSTTNAKPDASDPPQQRRQSAAQSYQASIEGARRGSLPNSILPQVPVSGTATAGQGNGTGVLIPAPNNHSLLMPAPPNTASTQMAKRNSTASGKQRRQMNINALYGEPSVRLQLGTKMNVFFKMKLPSSQELSERSLVVTEVSRPDDPLDKDGDRSGVIMRTQTHTDSISGVYRLVWTSVSAYNAPKSYPKFLLYSQRVHEVRPTVDGAGQEICEYWDWECQKGVMAKKNIKLKPYMEARMVEWGRRLGDFCESMGGAVERRDFVA